MTSDPAGAGPPPVPANPANPNSTSRYGGADGDWLQCPGCRELIYRKRWNRNLKVCPECRYHAKLTVDERIDLLVDRGSLVRIGEDVRPRDILGFVDTKPYDERLAESQARTGNNDAIVCGTARIEGRPIVLVVLDFRFLGGSMGSVVGELIARAARRAIEEATPMVIVCASGGARMQEGAISLMQLAKTSQELRRLKEAGVLTINLNTDPTYGGATASFAMLGDVIIAEPGARVGFAGPEVIKQTIRQELPPGFQTAEFLWDNGQIDMVAPRETLRATISRLVLLHTAHVSRIEPGDTSVVVTDPNELNDRTPSELVALARNINRPTTLDYCAQILDHFVELHGDRLGGGNDHAIIGGLGMLGGRTVVVIGHQKGHEINELVYRNFGMPQPWGYHKTLRLMEYAARFGFPVVSFIDTPGAYPGIEAEQRGQGYAIAHCIEYMSGLPVPVVSLVTGEGGSGGALAIGVGNRVLIMENGYLSVISPEGAATILFKNAGAATRAAGQLRLSPRALLRLGVIDGVVREPAGGAHTDEVATADNVRSALLSVLADLSPMQPDELIAQRYQRFAAFGDPRLQPTLTSEVNDDDASDR